MMCGDFFFLSWFRPEVILSLKMKLNVPYNQVRMIEIYYLNESLGY